jgi:hypothetical protein
VALLIKVTQEISNIIPDSHRKRKKGLNELSNYQVYPNIFCADLNQEPRMLTELERKQIQNLLGEESREKALIYRIMFSLFLFFNVLGIFLCYLVSKNTGIIFLIVANPLLILLYFYTIKFRQKYGMRIIVEKEVSVREAVYLHTSVSKYGAHFMTYENNNGKIEVASYQGGIAAVKYGDKLLKIQQDNKYIFYHVKEGKVYAYITTRK